MSREPTGWVDPLVYSSVWVAAAAGMLCWAASLAMGVGPDLRALGMAFAGTLLVYNVDRLRDVERDRATTPVRTAFVTRHFDVLCGVVLGAAVAVAAFGLALGWRGAALLVPVGVLGFGHRRLKHLAWAKSSYIAAAWVLVVAGLPAALHPEATHLFAVGFVLTASLFANAVASNVRDHEAASQQLGADRALLIARAIAGLGALAALLSPAPVRPLVVVPLVTLAALVHFRAEERYGLVYVDGALLLGACAAVGWQGLLS